MRASQQSLTPRDLDILECLTLRVRVFSLSQLGRTWWGATHDPVRNAARRMRELVASGFVESYSLLAHPELSLSVPELFWTPGSPAPDLGAVAYRLQSRWTDPQ
ncbi:MAG: hypothetical protein KDA93_06715 [Planctomycetaceae bacterium]|nr:hypothetical protein [Planctomycetaceae bacterium]